MRRKSLTVTETLTNTVEEYDMYSKITKTEFVPSVMLITNPSSVNEKTHFFAPTKEYETIFEALDLVKKTIL
jgi:hypothetical protein